MATETTTGIRDDLAEHVRWTMTESETRYAADERYNVFAALDLEDADVLFVMANRALDSGVTDIDTFTLGYTQAITGAALDKHPASDAFTKGYEAGLHANQTPRDVDEVRTSEPAARSA